MWRYVIKKRYFIGVILVLLIIAYVSMMGVEGASDHPSASHHKTVTVTGQTHRQTLYFQTQLAPLSAMPVMSPMSGMVTRVFFDYGVHVQKGQPLLVIHPTHWQEQYRERITTYIETKSNYENSRRLYEGDKTLWAAGVLSHNAFEHSQSQYRTDHLAYVSSREALMKWLKPFGVSSVSLSDLDLAHPEALDEWLHRQLKDITVKAPRAGVVLFPVSQSDTDDKEGKARLGAGVSVQEGQSLFLLGDWTGVSVLLHVSELHIKDIHVGQQVLITGDAFPALVLKGRVSEVGAQAEAGGGHGGSVFTVRADVPKLPAADMSALRVGMSAHVSLVLQAHEEMRVPLLAVKEHAGHPAVFVKREGEWQWVPVTVASTTVSDAVIGVGLKKGDQVALND